MNESLTHVWYHIKFTETTRAKIIWQNYTCDFGTLKYSMFGFISSLMLSHPNAKLCWFLEKTYTYYVFDLATNATDLLPIFNSIKILDFPEITTSDNNLTKPRVCVCVRARVCVRVFVCVCLACSNVACLDTYMINFVVSQYKIVMIYTLFSSQYKIVSN
jgi:hypothetical protein